MYITTKIQRLAIARKRKKPCAGSDQSEDDSNPEDSGPSKKTATNKFKVKSSENIPLPRSGPVPVITMSVYIWGEEEMARILLDTGSTIHLISQMFAK